MLSRSLRIAVWISVSSGEGTGRGSVLFVDNDDGVWGWEGEAVVGAGCWGSDDDGGDGRVLVDVDVESAMPSFANSSARESRESLQKRM